MRRPAALYQYTNAEGLLSMLRTGHLWATDAAYLNDPNELRYGFDLMSKVASDQRRLQGTRVLKDVLLMIEDNLLDKTENARVYVASFSRNRDLLSQWRGYASFGGGYAVGLRTANLFGGSAYAVEPFRVVRPVIYEQELQVRVIAKWLRRIVPSRGADRDEVFERMLELFSEHLMTFKHPSYQEEGEWRLIQFGRFVDGETIWPASFRVRGSQVVPYADIDLTQSKGPLKGKLPVVEIVCGPTISRERGIKALQQLCESLGYVYRSEDEERASRRGDRPEVRLSWSRAPFLP